VGVRLRDPRIPESNTSCAVRLGWLVTHTIPPFLQPPNDTTLVGCTHQVDCARPALPGCLHSACSHTDPFANPETGEQPFDPGPPARLTVNPVQDGTPSWLPDGSAILYSAQQPNRLDLDVCLAELPPTGGQQRRLVNIRGNGNSTDAAQSSAASADGRIALLSAGSGSIGGTSLVFLDLALIPTLDGVDAQRVHALPLTPLGGPPRTTPDTRAGSRPMPWCTSASGSWPSGSARHPVLLTRFWSAPR
jgi:hypothetical protein